MANVFASDWEFAHEGVSLASVTKAGGAELLGATVYELEPEARWADLHAHYANEELIIVLAGSITLHMRDGGSRELATGEVAVCRRGREGTHRIENGTNDRARVLMVSTMNMPEVVEYPERGTVFVMTEPPFTQDTGEAERHGRILRVFERDSGRPVPPDA